jgi:hypothetical protein
MKTRQNINKMTKTLKIRLSMLFLCVLVTTNAFGSWAPLQDVQAGKETVDSTTTVWYKVYDPVLERWMEGSESYSSSYRIELTNIDGVVAWIARKSSGNRVDAYIGYAVYNPIRGRWSEDIKIYQKDFEYSYYEVGQLKNNDGIVCWHVKFTYTNMDAHIMNSERQCINYAVYDPEEAIWKDDRTMYTVEYNELFSTSQLITQEDVIAWIATRKKIVESPTSYIVGYAVYDPASKSWQADSDWDTIPVSSLAIRNATVHYQIDGTDYVKGYDPSLASWYDGATRPLAYFTGSPLIGSIPLHVWFMDMSIGALSWEWDFGDDAHSSERSSSHIFTESGDFTVIQTITGSKESDSTAISIIATEPSVEVVRTRIYVDDDAIGANDGSSWENAYVYLQDALADANNSEKPVEIRIAQGTYTPDKGGDITQGDLRATFQLLDYVTIKGGFAGLGSPDPNTRDIAVHETILSGNLIGSDADVNNPSELLDEPTRQENSFHVVNGSGTIETAVLDGLTITAGNANDSNFLSTHSQGGGMYNMEGNPTLNNCTFRGNSARRSGSGMYNTNSNPTLTNCTFQKNYARYRGGGMYNTNSNPTLTNCIFKNNSASTGGAIYNDESSSNLTSCIFGGNTANEGGGIYNLNCSNIGLINCTFVGNYAEFGNASVSNSTNQYVPSYTKLINCILWDGGTEIWNNDVSTIDITHSDIQGSLSSVYDPNNTVIWGDGNIDTDPLFIDKENGDYHLKSQAGRWDPVGETWIIDDVTSPCIDAGDPNSPVSNEPEPNGGRINMGAYGGTAEASKSPEN